MRKQTLFKKLLSSILVAIIVLGQFSGFSFVSKAATITTNEGSLMYLALSKTNKDSENEIGYANLNDKMIWNMMHSTNSEGTDEVSSSNIYCIKAGDGETWATTPTARVKYDWYKTFDKTVGTTPSEEVNTLVSGEYFNEILWLIDNLYVPGESDKKDFLEQADIYYDELEGGYIYISKNGHDYSNISGASDVYGEYTLTDDDIIAIQQAAIWYFTNYEDANYNFKGINSWLRYTTDGNSYTTFSSNKLEEKARNVYSYILFNYLIDEAIAATADLEDATYELKKTTAKLWLSTTNGVDNQEQPVIEVHKIEEPVVIEKTEVSVEKVWNDNQNEDSTRPSNIKVQLYADEVKQGDSIELNLANSWKYTWTDLLKESEGKIINYTVKELNEAGEPVENGGNYNLNYKTQYVEENSKTTITNTYTYTPEKLFDLSLRKSIAEIKDSTGNIKSITNIDGQDATRNIAVDATPLIAESDTTALYNHRKDPVLVEVGDTVKYAITIYNEGEQDGYAKVIKDQLPGTWGNGLRLQTNSGKAQSSNGNIYNVQYDTTNNIVIFTMSEESPKNVLKAYEGTEILDSETIYIECKVMGHPDRNLSKVLTNIAYIAEDYNAETNTVLDRDSKPSDHPQKTGSELITDDIGYIGNEININKDLKQDVHFKGEEDDDDFEKLVVLPEAFDLSLRKNITKVNGQEVANSRTPVIDTTKLDAGDETTAEYNHRKDAVVVENGDLVEYNITIYNEGSINGVATIVKDQLPTGLKLKFDLFNKNGEEYFVTSTKGNVYKVSYNQNSNLVTFELDENKTTNVVLLKAHETGKLLDNDVITLKCEVNVKADDNQNIYLTNIAYIYEAEQEDGTVVTNQVAGTDNGSDADRDSEPHTYPNKKAEELKTEGNIGYTGNTSNRDKDLKQNVHFEGEQDDDDFEKLVILPEAFDLSLRKNITKVNGEEVANTRTPDIEIATLDSGDKTTAEYNHRKDAVVVENGDFVEYNITIYNEGSINGVATIVKDQLPTGLKLNFDLFDKDEEEYFVTSTKGNVYKVTYDENKNIVTFKLDENKTTNVVLLQAHEIGKKLDSDVITLKCEVNVKADDDKNIYLTNIAYIYEAEQEDGTVITNQTSGADSDLDSEPHTYPNKKAEELKTEGNIGYIGNTNNKNKDLSQNVHFEGEQDDDDFEKLVVLPKIFDLKLIKFITAINEESTGNRVISVNTNKLNINNQTTAEYILEKNPVSVKAGDFVTYTLRVYNEGDYDGIATQISEDIPEGLEFIVITDSVINSWDGKELKDITEEIKASNMYEKIVEVNSNWGYSLESSIITTNALTEDVLKGFGKENQQYTDLENKIDYAEVQVIFKVKEDVEANTLIRNEATISQDKALDNLGEEVNVIDRDSDPEKWNKENSNKTYDTDGKWPIYKEDDEDYDNIITKTFDLSLRKQIIQINDALYTNRYSNLDENGKYANTLYDYYDVYSNKPKVKAGDKVVYSIRVYNEGEIDGYADLIVDSLPAGLEFVEYTPGDGSINDQYGWTLVEGTENKYQTDYLSYEKDVNEGTAKSTIIKAYNGAGEASYKEIYIECKIKEDATKQDSLINVAQIAEDSDFDGKEINDKDSIPGTSDNESKWKVEDDLDLEVLELQEFDLSLRKFITTIENGENIKQITSRIPQVSYNKETKQLVYTHTKDALVVHVGDTVIYTIRVYNEGDIDGYASEIKDDIPEYLEYLPKHSTNLENEWVMYDKDGNVTEKVEEAVYIKTEHLAKGKGIEADKESEKTNLLKAFNFDSKISDTNPDYKEVKVAFKVKDPNSTEYEIVNFAQISEDSDSEGEPIDDRDSVPDNGKEEPKEDDEDIEKVKVEYFDLSLLKYVTKVLVNENGVERVIETGNVGDENDIIPNAQVDKKNIYKSVIKFVYSIKITNEGQIAGEATEITDYIPEGLEFVAEDNPHWTDEGNNIISTKQLTGSTLQPGESVEVEVVLRWINGDKNFGPKTNVAEISEDYNEENVPDRDSTPDNKVDGEDDIDDATVLLSANQGGGIQSIYTYLIITFLSIILVGTILIKKFVL